MEDDAGGRDMLLMLLLLLPFPVIFVVKKKLTRAETKVDTNPRGISVTTYQKLEKLTRVDTKVDTC